MSGRVARADSIKGDVKRKHFSLRRGWPIRPDFGRVGLLTFTNHRQLATLSYPSHPTANRNAAQTSFMRAVLNCATRFPNRSCDTVTILCRLTAHADFIPSSTLNMISDGTPRIVVVIGATVTVDRYSIALLRVNTTTGRFLSGAAKLYSRTSPRAIRPATPPPLPTHETHPRRQAS